jgi:vacuolar-type H+-ATPase subunit H
MSGETMVPPNDALGPIKRVTDVEGALDATLAQLRASLKAQADALQRDTDALLLQARADGERDRDLHLATARAEGDAEAAKIVAAGSAQAVQIQPKTVADLAPRQDAIVGAVLGEFRPAGKKSAT